MKVEDFEQAVWEVETIRVVVRAPAGAQVAEYSNQNAADEKWGVEEWLRKRVRPKLSGKAVAVSYTHLTLPTKRIV